VVRNKTRHVYQGYNQHEGIYCTKTFAHVARLKGMKRTIGYTNICSTVKDHGIKFELYNQVLVLKDQDSEYIRAFEEIEKLKTWKKI
jgi:hypothetical protein